MKEQLQTARARRAGAAAPTPAAPSCAPLAAEWDGMPSPLWRKRFARHIRDCAVCRRAGHDLLPIDRLLAGLPLLPLPAGFGCSPAARGRPGGRSRGRRAAGPDGRTPPPGTTRVACPPTRAAAERRRPRGDRPRGRTGPRRRRGRRASWPSPWRSCILPRRAAAPSWRRRRSPRPSAVATPSVAPSPSARPSSTPPVAPAVSSARRASASGTSPASSPALANVRGGLVLHLGARSTGHHHAARASSSCR